MTNRDEVRFAILRVIDEAGDEGILDEDLKMAVLYYVDTDQNQIDVETGELWATDMIQRQDTTSPWRRAKTIQ